MTVEYAYYLKMVFTCMEESVLKKKVILLFMDDSSHCNTTEDMSLGLYKSHKPASKLQSVFFLKR